MQAKGKSERGFGWQSKTPAERKTILGIVRGAGALNCSWKRTAALLDVHETTLIRWRHDDPEGKIDTAYEVGKASAGKKVMGWMMDRAADPDAPGSAGVLIHLSKSLCNMSDKSTHAVVTPEDLAGEGKENAGARRSAALSILGLEALDTHKAEQDDPGEPNS